MDFRNKIIPAVIKSELTNKSIGCMDLNHKFEADLFDKDKYLGKHTIIVDGRPHSLFSKHFGENKECVLYFDQRGMCIKIIYPPYTELV